MRCSRVQYLYEEYRAGALPLATASRIDEHLAGCPACCEYYEANDDISELISKCDEVVHPGSPYLDQISGKVIGNLFDESGAFKSEELPAAPKLPNRLKRWRFPLWMTGGIAATALFTLGLGPLLKGGIGSFSVRSFAEDLGIFAPGQKRVIAEAQDEIAPAASPTPSDEIPPSTMPSPTVADGQFPSIDDLAGAASANALALSTVGTRLPEQELSKSVRRSELEAQADASRRRAYQGDFKTQVDSARRPPRMGLQVGPGVSQDLAPRIIEQLITVEAMGTPEARERLIAMMQQLSQSVEDQIAGSAAAAMLSKQFQLFRQAQADYESGRFDRAIQNFHLTYSLDSSTLLACRAAMSVADIYFYEYGDFSEAQRFYERCKTSGIPEALTPKETEHIAKQMEILDRYRANNWVALRALYSVGRDPWASMVPTLAYLSSSAELSSLMPEAARTVLQRFQEVETNQSFDRPSDSLVIELVDIIEKGVASQQDNESKAWLQLVSGELIWIRFRNADPAMQAYEKTLAIDEKSVPGELAAKRIRQIREQNLGATQR